jgi:hypothetical protein
VHHAGAELLEELPLPEDDRDLPSEPLGRDRVAAGRSGVPDEDIPQADPTDEEDDGQNDDDREGRGG